MKQMKEASVEQLKKDVTDLKDEMSELKQMFAKMYKLLMSRTSKAEPEVKEKENQNKNFDKNEKQLLEESEKSSMRSKDMQDKFKCEMCEYETCKNATLNKHMNTKHGQSHCVKEPKRKETNAQ